MPKTKTTPVKPKEICPLCFIEIEGRDAWTAHIVKCAGSAIQCTECHISFKKKAYLKKHMRRKHGKGAEAIAEGTDASRKGCEESDDSDWDEDPGALLIGTVSDDSEDEADVRNILETTQSTTKATDEDLLAGRVVRKRTHPDPVVGSKAAKRSEESIDEVEKEDRSSDSDEVPTDRAARVQAEVVDKSTGTDDASVAQRRPETKEVGTQSGSYRKRQKEVTVIKYKEGGKDIEKIIEVEEFFNM